MPNVHALLRRADMVQPCWLVRAAVRGGWQDSSGGGNVVSLKPGAKIKTHLLVAALIWSAVGIMLSTRGFLWLYEAAWLLLVPFAALAGTMKSKMVLDKVARRNMDRIHSREEGSCIGGVYSVGTWVLVLVMIFMGRLLRASSVPHAIVGFIYVTVGWALFWSSRLLWKGWRQSSQES